MPGICVGIAGGSGSGKTELVRRLCAALGDTGIVVLEQDAYYREQTDRTPSERAAKNYDHPDAIEFDLLVRHVRALKDGQPVLAPVYDFAAHNRAGYEQVAPGRLLIVEGILVLAVAELRSLFDVSVFVDQREDVRLARRIERDIRQRGRTEEDVVRQFHATAKPMHSEFVEPSRAYADIVIAGDSSGDDEADALAGRLRDMMRGDGPPRGA